MSAEKKEKYKGLATIPIILRGVGIAGVCAAVVALIAGFYFSSTDGTFRSKDFPTTLSKKVIGVVEGYERKTSVDGVSKYFVRASKATTFDDNHQEFETVLLRLFKDGDEDRFDSIRADRAIFVPDKDDTDQFRVFFAGDVEVNSETRLKVNTPQLQYRSKEELAIAEEKVDFERDNLSGTAGSATVDITKETLELKDDVRLVASGETDLESAKFDVKMADLNAGYAFIEKQNESVLLRSNVNIYVIPKEGEEISDPTRIKSQRAQVFFTDNEPRTFELEENVRIEQKGGGTGSTSIRAASAKGFLDDGLKSVNLVGKVHIASSRSGDEPVHIKSESASYDRTKERFELSNNVVVESVRDGKGVNATASKAIFLRNEGNLDLLGGVRIESGGDEVIGDSVETRLDEKDRIKSAVVTGNSRLARKGNGNATTLTGQTIDANFDTNGKTEFAKVRGETEIVSIPADKKDYARFALRAKAGLDVGFYGNGDVRSAETFGRTTIRLNEGNQAGQKSNRELTADKIKTAFRPSGNELRRAHAIGNAVLVETPIKKTPGLFVSKVTSPRFVCEFFGKNRAKQCDGVKRSIVERKPVSGSDPRQKLESDRVSAVFDENSGDISVFAARGRSRFSEGGRKGSADSIFYTESDGKVRLTGKPVVWDKSGRAKAARIVWDTKNDSSSLSGKVSTTYFDPGSTNNATPFSGRGTPVYVTAENAAFEHEERKAVYTGNARAWQGKNFVSGSKIFLEERTGRFYAEGKVKSGLYDASRTVGGRKSSSPVFVSAEEMLFERKTNRLLYRKKVDIRQGTDRIVSDTAEVYLNPDNSLSKTIARGDVIITQPNRKATGDYASYDAVSEVVRLRGEPATFHDSESGSSNGRVLTVDLKRNTLTNESRTTKNGNGRIRSVYKVKGGRLN